MWRSAVQLRAGLRYGGIAQLVEHLLCKQGVKSSNLFISTKNRSIDFFGWPILVLFCSKRRRFRYRMPHSQKVCNANQIFQLYQGIDISTTKRSTKMYAKLRCGGNLPLCLAFGTRNRLLRYGRDIRCQKQPSLVRDASSKARRTAEFTDCGQPPAAPDASSVRETAPARR